MSAGVIGGGGGPFAPDTDSPAHAAISGVSLGPQLFQTRDMASMTLTADRTFIVPWRCPDSRSVDAFAIQVSTANLTNDAEFGIFETDITGLQLGTKIAGATQTASFTSATYTEIAFTAASLTPQWYYLCISGIGAAAGPDIMGFGDTTAADASSNPIMGFGIVGMSGAAAGRLDSNRYFEASQDLDAIVAGQALTMPQGTPQSSMPMIRMVTE